jgi:hypothetical protein
VSEPCRIFPRHFNLRKWPCDGLCDAVEGKQEGQEGQKRQKLFFALLALLALFASRIVPFKQVATFHMRRPALYNPASSIGWEES